MFRVFDSYLGKFFGKTELYFHHAKLGDFFLGDFIVFVFLNQNLKSIHELVCLVISVDSRTELGGLGVLWAKLFAVDLCK